MPSMPLILNEWVIHDLRGVNSEERQRETLQFLIEVQGKCDHLLLLHGSQWMKKAFSLMTDSRVGQRRMSRFLHRMFIRNSSKCKVFHSDDIPPLSPKMQSMVSSEDSYLVALNLAVPASTIITTDAKLLEALRELPNITIRLRDEFLKNYT